MRAQPVDGRVEIGERKGRASERDRLPAGADAAVRCAALVLESTRGDATAAVLRDRAQFSPVYDVVSNSLPVKVSVETY